MPPKSCGQLLARHERTVFSDQGPTGQLVLSLPALSELMQDVEGQSQSLVELRILRDLTVARRNREVRARVDRLGRRSVRQRLQRRIQAWEGRVARGRQDDSKRFGTNLVGLFNQQPGRNLVCQAGQLLGCGCGLRKRPVKHGQSWSPVPEAPGWQLP